MSIRENDGAGEAGGLLNLSTLPRPPLSPVLRCPRCGRVAIGKNPEVFVGALTCGDGKKFGCGAHWWASRFQPGSIRLQLLADFDDAALVCKWMVHFGLPESIEQSMFWQIELTGNQLYRYNQDSTPGLRGRSTQLLKGVVALHR